MQDYKRLPSKYRGFLPDVDPLDKFEIKGYDILDQLGRELPEMLAQREFRKKIDSGILPVMDYMLDAGQMLDRVMMLYSFFASAYVHETPESPAKVLPYCLSLPLTNMSKILNRAPILSYDSYCLVNWKRKDPSKPIGVDNLELLQNFLGGIDEDWFILIHVEIEYRAGKVLDGIENAQESKSDEDMLKALQMIAEGIYDMCKVLDRMPENCDPNVYFYHVRPYIWSFEDVVYENIDIKPITYRGETGAQSSIIPAIVSALGVRHKDSMLTQHLKDMRQYMPEDHRHYISNLEDSEFNIREVVQGMNKEVKDSYNSCIEGLLRFRSTHLQYARDYIQSKVENPKGTGGTPYVKWLSQLKNETKEHLI